MYTTCLAISFFKKKCLKFHFIHLFRVYGMIYLWRSGDNFHWIDFLPLPHGFWGSNSGPHADSRCFYLYMSPVLWSWFLSLWKEGKWMYVFFLSFFTQWANVLELRLCVYDICNVFVQQQWDRAMVYLIAVHVVQYLWVKNISLNGPHLEMSVHRGSGS